MSSVNIAGDTSGSIAVSAPAIAGSNTLTLPAETGTVISSVSTGTVVTRTYTENTAYSSSAATIPSDNTIPQITEGWQVLSQAIVLKSATNRVRVTVSGSVTTSTGPDIGCAALFFDGGANAINAPLFTTTGIGYLMPVSFVFEHVPGVTGSRTYAVRIGVSTYTTYINGNTVTQLYGGVGRWAMVIEEIAP